jgi:enterochelin esterase family protein
MIPLVTTTGKIQGFKLLKDFKQLLTQIDQLKSDSDKQELVERFLQEVRKQGAPLVGRDNLVTILYAGEAKEVGLLGDMNNWREVSPLQRVDGTNLFYSQEKYPAEARFEYVLQLDRNEDWFVDPLNPFVLFTGLGMRSELTMPDYRHHPYFEEFRHGEKGRFDGTVKHELPTGCLPYPHTVYVYLPPEYHEPDRHFPVIYFQDGEDYIEFAQVVHTIDNLIRQEIIHPLIAVFVAPPNRHLPEFPNRMSEYGLNENYVEFFSDELISFIDSRYRTHKSATARLVVGDSFGGLISLAIAFYRPDVFGMCYSQSGYFCFQKDRLMQAVDNSKVKPIKLFLDVGHYEKQVGALFLPMEETDFLLANRGMRDVLSNKGYDYIYREYPEGHNWGNWRRHLIDALEHFFGK